MRQPTGHYASGNFWLLDETAVGLSLNLVHIQQLLGLRRSCLVMALSLSKVAGLDRKESLGAHGEIRVHRWSQEVGRVGHGFNLGAHL